MCFVLKDACSNTNYSISSKGEHLIQDQAGCGFESRVR